MSAYTACAEGTSLAAPLRIVDSVEDLIGGTPLFRLRFDDQLPDVEVLAKLESANPLSSIKDRVARRMLDTAEEQGLLSPGTGTVLEATSGNTGISLAALAAGRGYRCVVTLPNSSTPERICMLRALGAEVVLTPWEKGYQGAIERAEELHREIPGSWFAAQHRNAANVMAHRETTGPEIWSATGGRVDTLVCGVGTGGTLTGTAGYLKDRNPLIEAVAVEPADSPVLSEGRGGLHRVPGLNGGFTAPTTDVGIIDRVLTVTDEAAVRMSHSLASRAGLLVGVSSGAAADVCRRLARSPEYAGQTIVTIFPDTGERYLSQWGSSRIRDLPRKE